MKSSALWRGLAFAVLAFAFGMAVYRAKTQTIAHDEAMEYERFLDGGVYHASRNSLRAPVFSPRRFISSPPFFFAGGSSATEYCCSSPSRSSV